jgi:hypothetical protein
MNIIDPDNANTSPQSSPKAKEGGTVSLATSIAAIQQLNEKSRSLPHLLKFAVYDQKVRATAALCAAGYCVGYTSTTSRGSGKEWLLFRFQLGRQRFGWTLPAHMLEFSPAAKEPPTPYADAAADLTAIVLASDRDLLRMAAQAFAQGLQEQVNEKGSE